MKWEPSFQAPENSHEDGNAVFDFSSAFHVSQVLPSPPPSYSEAYKTNVKSKYNSAVVPRLQSLNKLS